MAAAIRDARRERTLGILTATVFTAAILGALYLGRTLLIPFTLAVYLTFLLSPVVKRFQRLGLRRIPSVLLVSSLAAAAVLGIGWILVSQCASFIGKLPDYTDRVQHKIQAIKAATESHGLNRLDRMVHDLDGSGQPAADAHSGPATEESAGSPVPVVVESRVPNWLQWLPNFVPPIMEFVGQLGLVVVLAIFMLLSREELRNRFISLIGHGHLTLTTKAVDDASQRISRYLLMQIVINGSFAVLMTIGLTLIGIEYAPLWGFLCGLLRYVPYIGSPAAIVFPMAMSVLQSDGWVAPLSVLSLFLVLELIAANVVEPWLFGHSMGVSAVALLAAAAFWSLLWGPIGLVLACPLTVCLVVLGKYVPQLEFLATLLSDQPALNEEMTYYQRLSARDQDEAAQIALNYRESHPLPEVFDGLMVPALTHARRDLYRGGISEQDAKFIHVASQEILDELIEQESSALDESKQQSSAGGRASLGKPVRILLVPAHDESEELIAKMLAASLDQKKWDLQVTAVDLLATEVETQVEDEPPSLVCIMALMPGSLSHTRYLCKRLRARFPDQHILAALWCSNASEKTYQERLQAAGASHVETSLHGVLGYLEAWRPPLLQMQTLDAASAGQLSGTGIA
jgi:predicted PurR-regulated permease PerM